MIVINLRIISLNIKSLIFNNKDNFSYKCHFIFKALSNLIWFSNINITGQKIKYLPKCAFYTSSFKNALLWLTMHNSKAKRKFNLHFMIKCAT